MKDEKANKVKDWAIKLRNTAKPEVDLGRREEL